MNLKKHSSDRSVTDFVLKYMSKKTYNKMTVTKQPT